jgi:hypothetical protein
MKAFVNQLFFTQTTFDSASPAGSAVLVRRFEQEGPYNIGVVLDDEVVERVPLVVAPGGASGETEDLRHFTTPQGEDLRHFTTPQGDVPQSISFDVKEFSHREARPTSMPTVAPGSYVSFTTRRPTGHHVVVTRGTGEEEEFDSRRAGAECIFAVTLVRPGTYSLLNVANGEQGRIIVTYPVVSDAPYRPPSPLSVECTADGFSENPITLSPAQGIIFRFSTESRIQIELVEPDDGPSARRRSAPATWSRPPELGLDPNR